MTPGQLALQEASRLEAARVYAATLEQHRSAVAAASKPAPARRRRQADAEIAYWHRKGASVASIALRIGSTKLFVRDVLHRLAASAAANTEPMPTQHVEEHTA